MSFNVCKLYLNKTDYKKIVLIHTLLYLNYKERTLNQEFLSFKFEHLLHDAQIKIYRKSYHRKYITSITFFNHLVIHFKIQLNNT